MDAPRQVENRFSAGPHRPDRAIALFGPHLIPTPPPGFFFPSSLFSLFLLSLPLPFIHHPPFSHSLSHLFFASLLPLSPSIYSYLTSFTMGSVSNGSKPGTFLFTSESVGEGHPDKIA